MKKLFVLSFLFSLLFVSQSSAQWWVQGGNLLWPYGTVTVKDSFSVGGNANFEGTLTAGYLSVDDFVVDNTTNLAAPVTDVQGTLNAYSDVNISGNLVVDGTINGVKYYTALLTQSGTDNPTVVELENTLGFTVTWSRDSQGRYSGSFGGSIDPEKLFINAQRVCYDAMGGNFRSINWSVQSTLIQLREDYEDMEYWSNALINYNGVSYYPVQFILYP